MAVLKALWNVGAVELDVGDGSALVVDDGFEGGHLFACVFWETRSLCVNVERKCQYTEGQTYFRTGSG